MCSHVGLSCSLLQRALLPRSVPWQCHHQAQRSQLHKVSDALRITSSNALANVSYSLNVCWYSLFRPLQFNYLSYELFLEKRFCQTPKKKEKKVDLGVLRTKVVWKFSVRLQKKKKKSSSFKNIHCEYQLQVFISAAVEPQIWGCIAPTLQVAGINWSIDFI